VSRRTRAALVTACGVAGLVLMIGFDAAVTRALGVACIIGFVAGGLFLIASPALLLSGDEDSRR
jgi:hypothetical protein